MTTQNVENNAGDIVGGYKYGWHDAEIVRQMSEMKGEPQWMLDYRLKALEIFEKKAMPSWGPDLSAIDFQDIYYYVKPTETESKTWEDVPADMKRTFDRLGIPEAEQKFLSGVGAQYDSEVVYHSVKEELSKLGVVFMGTDQALVEYPEIFRKHFGTVVPAEDNKFSALNAAVWSGGSFFISEIWATTSRSRPLRTMLTGLKSESCQPYL